MHHMDANKTYEEKTRYKLNKNAGSVLNKSCKRYSIKQQFFGHLPPITETIQQRHAEEATMNS